MAVAAVLPRASAASLVMAAVEEEEEEEEESAVVDGWSCGLLRRADRR